MHAEMINPQEQILGEIEDRAFTRDNVAKTYAFCIRQRHEVDFDIVNRAILKRWSPAGLLYIKKRAWQWLAGREK